MIYERVHIASIIKFKTKFVSIVLFIIFELEINIFLKIGGINDLLWNILYSDLLVFNFRKLLLKYV